MTVGAPTSQKHVRSGDAITPICIVQAFGNALFGAQNTARDGGEMSHPADCTTAIVSMLAVVVGRLQFPRRAR